MSTPQVARPAAPAARAAAVLVLALLAGLLAAVAVAPPAAAARTVDVVLTDRQPATVSIAPGDSVRFVNGEAVPLGPPHRVTSTQRAGSSAWEYESPLLAAGQSTEPVVFSRAGTFLFLDRRGGPGPLGSDLLGRIVVREPPPPSPAAPPPAAGTTAPPPPAQGPPPTSAPTGAPAGGGTDPLPPADVPPADPLADGGVVPPAITDLLGTPDDDAPDGPLVQALEGPLPGAGTLRGFGLPAALAALTTVGVASLLVRVLLADPAARNRPLTPVAT